jgi:Ni/Fe-hydrogenase subunit HybB-like protein
MMNGYVFPNEIHVNWGLFIVLYPYITGLVAGAFIVSSLYHVFGKSELKPVSRLSLITALAFLFGAPVPLLAHLGHPLRALNIMFTPHLTSSMAGFGYIYSFYLILCLLEAWFMFRRDLVILAQTRHGFARVLYSILTLGAKDISPAALHTDHRIVSILAVIGIPAACFLHGYVGFIFGSIKANPWWSTPLMPVIFLLSAIVSGIGLLIVIYVLSNKLRRKETDFACLMSLNRYLWLFLLLASILEVLEVLHMGYEGKEEWAAVRGLILQIIPVTYIGVQMIFGEILPLVLLPLGRWKRLSTGVSTTITVASSILVLISVLAMRFNVVIGGQLMSKSMAGYTQFYPNLIGDEGIVPTAMILAFPVLALLVLVRVLPPWLDEKPKQIDETKVTQLGAKWELKAGEGT